MNAAPSPKWRYRPSPGNPFVVLAVMAFGCALVYSIFEQLVGVRRDVRASTIAIHEATSAVERAITTMDATSSRLQSRAIRVAVVAVVVAIIIGAASVAVVVAH